jgi:hypothetical protein
MNLPAATEAYLDRIVYAGPHGLDVPSVMREARLRNMLAFIHAWGASRGTCRAIWRREALPAIAEFRKHHLVPERARYRAAIARSRQ